MYVFLCLALTLIILSEMTFSRQTLGSAFTWQDSRDFRDGLITEVKRNKSRKWGLVEQRCQGDSISISSHALMLLQARSQYFFPSFPAQRPGHRNTNTVYFVPSTHPTGKPQEPSRTANKIPSWESGGTKTSVFSFIHFSHCTDTAHWFSNLWPTTL